MVEAANDLPSAPTRVARRGRGAPREPKQDPTKIDRRTPNRVDLGDLPTLVVPPPITMSSASRRRPKEIAEDVASQFDVSPFESFEGDVETIADATDDDDSREHFAAAETVAENGAGKDATNTKDESAFAGMLPPMAQVWNQADAIVTEPVFSIDVATHADAVELIEAVEDAASEQREASEDAAQTTRAPRRARWVALLVALTACAAGAFIVDERIAAEGLALRERALAIAQDEVVPELRNIEGRARWIASRTASR